MGKGRLFLIPTTIAENSIDVAVLPAVKNTIRELDYFLVENVRTSRRFISALKLDKNIEVIKFGLLDKRTVNHVIKDYLNPVLSGQDAGVMSEAGCPGIADPGARVVKIAHQLGIQVIPLVGPSSIVLALMASGLNGQCFKFHGYLPIDKRERVAKLRKMEKESQQLNQSQIFIETPYRNDKLAADIVNNCAASTKLCIAKDLTGAFEFVKTNNIKTWKGDLPKLHKTPTVFILYAGGDF